MLIARVITDADGLERRLQAFASGLAELGSAEGVRVGSKPLRDGLEILQVATDKPDAATLRQLVDEHLAAHAGMIARATDASLRLFVSDMDSTMIEQECIDELADFAGLKEEVSAITEKAMRGELDFKEALRERVGLLAGLSEENIRECLDTRITPMPGALTLVQTLKSRRCRTVLVTGGFHHFADPVGEQLGFDRVVGNRLEMKDGTLTGGLEGPISDKSTKEAVLREEHEALGSGTVMASGDGANDIPMLQAADIGFAYRAKPIARDAANGWVDRGDLTALLDLLDIPEDQWVRD